MSAGSALQKVMNIFSLWKWIDNMYISRLYLVTSALRYRFLFFWQWSFLTLFSVNRFSVPRVLNCLLALLFTISLVFSTRVVYADADSEVCTSTWCDLYNWGDDQLAKFDDWIMELVDEHGEELRESARDKALAHLRNVGLSVLKNQFPFLAVGDSGPSELSLAVERILDSIEQSESNVIDAIVNESAIQKGVDWSALKQDVAYYFLFSSDEEKMQLYPLLSELLTDSTALRLAFQVDRTNFSSEKRDFDTYNYDSYHVYLNVVALQIVILTEHTRMTMLVNPDVTSDEIESKVLEALDLLFSPDNPDSVTAYVVWLDSHWRDASDARFPSDFSASLLSEGDPEVAGKGNFSSKCSNSTPAGYSEFRYRPEFEEYSVKIRTWRSGSPYRNYCIVVEDSFGSFIGKRTWTTNKFGAPSTDNTWVMQQVENAISKHKDLDYVNYLKRGHGSTRQVLDDWWKLVNYPASRPALVVDAYLRDNDPLLDSDGDGLINSLEWTVFGQGNGHLDPDVDKDGIYDGYEYFHGLDPNNYSDAYYDLDLDGYNNYEEYKAGSDIGADQSTPLTIKAALLAVIQLMIM